MDDGLFVWDTAAAVVMGEDCWKVDLQRPPHVIPLSLEDALDIGAYAEPLVGEIPQDAVSKSVRVEPGVLSKSSKEFFLSGAIAGRLLFEAGSHGTWTASLSKINVIPKAFWPGVSLPSERSALPESIEKSIPEHLQFWKASNPQAARDEIMHGGFLPPTANVVDKQLQLCTSEVYLYEPAAPASSSSMLVRALGGEDVEMDLVDADEFTGLDDRPTLVNATETDVKQLSKVVDAILSEWSNKQVVLMVPNTQCAVSSARRLGRVWSVKSVDPTTMFVSLNIRPNPDYTVYHDVGLNKTVWSTAYVNKLPDSAFLHIEGGGKKDDEGKTIPRSLRYFPVRGADGQVDPAHVRNAISRAPQAKLPQEVKDGVQATARRLLGESKTSEKGTAIPGYGSFEECLRNQLSTGRSPQDAARVCRTLQESKGATVKVLKSEDSVEERYVLAVVLEPEVVDAQNEIYSADEIRKACHRYMEYARGRKFMHRVDVSDGVAILENYIAPASFDLNGTLIKAGTWLIGLRINDEQLWNMVKSGDLTGVSVGGLTTKFPDVVDM